MWYEWNWLALHASYPLMGEVLWSICSRQVATTKWKKVKQLTNGAKCDKYLLLAEFSVRTVNYGPSFFPSIMAKAQSARAINRWEKKRGSVIYSTDRKNEADKMFIIWLLPVSGTGNKCRTRDLTNIWQTSRKKVFIGSRKE